MTVCVKNVQSHLAHSHPIDVILSVEYTQMYICELNIFRKETADMKFANTIKCHLALSLLISY